MTSSTSLKRIFLIIFVFTLTSLFLYLPLLPLWVTQLGASTHLLTASLHNFTHHLKKWTINRIPSPAKSPFFSHFFSSNTTSSPVLPSTNQELPRIRAADSDWLDTREGAKYSYYGDGTCRKRANRPRLIEILTHWKEIARKHNITYMLTYGSLLGAWRNGEVIPYDTDMDIHIDSRDNIKLERIKNSRTFDTRSPEFHLALDVDWRVLPVRKRRRVTCNGKLLNKNHDSCTFTGPLGRLIKGYELYMDIWDFERVNGKVYDRARAGHYYHVSDIYPLKKCMYMGVQVWCPRKPTAVFAWLYGTGKKLGSQWLCRKGRWFKRRL